MKSIIFIAVCAAVTSALPYKVAEGQNNYDGLFVRNKRADHETKYGLNQNGNVPYVNHKSTFVNNQEHKFEANAFAKKDFVNHGPISTGGNLNYAHKQSGSGVVLGASNAGSAGTNVGASGVYNLYRNGNFGLDLKANYNRQFGGAFGNQPPIYGVEIRGGYAFPKRG